MLVPLSRAPIAMRQALMRRGLPSLASLPRHQIRSGGRGGKTAPKISFGPPAGDSKGRVPLKPEFSRSTNAVSGILSLWSMNNTDRLVAPLTLHYVLFRNICNLSTKASGPRLPQKKMLEPYGSVVSAFEPKFEKIGFSKILENEYSMEFSDGVIKVRLVTDTDTHPKLTMCLSRENSRYAYVCRLMDQTDGAQTGQKKTGEWEAVAEKINSFSKKSHDQSLPFKPMVEPYGSLIEAIEPEFSKLDYFKIQGDEYSVTFSDGVVSVVLSTDRDSDAPLNINLFKKNGPYFSLELLQEKLDSPENREKYSREWRAIVHKYGLSWNDDTPKVVRDEGERLLFSLRLKRAAEFLQAHKKTLSELTMDEAR